MNEAKTEWRSILSFAVQYRRKDDGIEWIEMAAFDSEMAAQRYRDGCSGPDCPWEYRVTPATPPPIGDGEGVLVDAYMVRAIEAEAQVSTLSRQLEEAREALEPLVAHTRFELAGLEVRQPWLNLLERAETALANLAAPRRP